MHQEGLIYALVLGSFLVSHHPPTPGHISVSCNLLFSEVRIQISLLSVGYCCCHVSTYFEVYFHMNISKGNGNPDQRGHCFCPCDLLIRHQYLAGPLRKGVINAALRRLLSYVILQKTSLSNTGLKLLLTSGTSEGKDVR